MMDESDVGFSMDGLLINAVLETSQNKGYTSVQLGVIDNNAKALEFWEKLGFGKIRESKVEQEGKSDWNIIVMKKRMV